MRQVVDLEKSQDFQSLHIALVSIATDAVADLQQAEREWKTTTPLLSDPEAKVCKEYGVMRWQMPSCEPGHTFVLVGSDGKVKWVRDYGAPENSGRMYVPVDELLSQLRNQL